MQSLANRTQFEWHNRIDCREHSSARCSGNYGKLSTGAESWTGQDVAWTSKKRAGSQECNVCKVREDPSPAEGLVADEPLRTYDSDKDSIAFQDLSSHLFVVTTPDKIENAVN